MVAVSIILLLTVVNLRGLKAGKTVQNVFALAKLSALLALVVLAISQRVPGAAISQSSFWTPMRDGRPLDWWLFLPVLGIATVGAFFAYDAWNNITFTGAEVKNPKRTLPLSLGLGVGLVMAIYVLVNIAYLCALPLEGIQRAPEDRVATAAAQNFLDRERRRSWQSPF